MQRRRTATAEAAPESRLLAPGSPARFGRKPSLPAEVHLAGVYVRSLPNGPLLASLPAGRYEADGMSACLYVICSCEALMTAAVHQCYLYVDEL